EIYTLSLHDALPIFVDDHFVEYDLAADAERGVVAARRRHVVRLVEVGPEKHRARNLRAGPHDRAHADDRLFDRRPVERAALDDDAVSDAAVLQERARQ